MVDAPSALQSSLADRYRIEREIGAGGMAIVYLARDLRHNRAVALKVLRADIGAAMGADRFRREVALTAAFQHPHILSLFDSGEAAGQLYYVTPYVDGETLKQKLKREGQLRIADALEITRQIADALDYAHHRGIVHRDIKPANILLDAHAHDGRAHALVADFGIAHALPTGADSASGSSPGTSQAHAHARLTSGTPMYMSPEQTMGDNRVDGRSDVYSLACVVYEMLAGQPPFTGATVEALAARKFSGTFPSITPIRPHVEPSVDAVIARALVPIPADRYASAGEFAGALAEALGATDSSGSLSRRQATGDAGAGIRGRIRRPGLVALGAVALALIAVAGWAFTTWQTHAATPASGRGTRDPQALVLYRQAHDEIDRRTAASIARAVALLQRAIARDSGYSDAWADLTRALVFAQNNR
ncbi:MAG: serine/threonine-protein kinase [Gemmatimonadaceae bacterium]